MSTAATTWPDRPVSIAAPISEVAQAEGLDALTDLRVGYEVMERLRQTDRAQVWMRRRIWPRNALYDQGEQNIRFDGTTLAWTRKTRERRINRQQANLLGNRGDHWVADLTQGMPAYTGVPENRDLQSRRVAKLGERLMQSDWRRCNLDLARSLALRDVWRFGSGFIETCWDPAAGEVKPEYEQDSEASPVFPGAKSYKRTESGARASNGFKATGAVVDRAVSPLLVYVPITTELPLMECCAWVIRLEWATEYQIREMAGGELPEDFAFTDDLQFRYTDDFLARIGSGERRQRSSEAMGLHLVVHYYELRKPIDGFVQGKHYIVSSERKIFEEPLQGWGTARGDRYPLFLFAGRPRARTFWCHPEIQDRIDPQRRRNQAITHELTLLGRYSMATPLAAKGSEVPDFIPFDGSTVQYNQAYNPPGVLQVPQAPPGLFQMPDMMTKEIDEVGGDEPASRGVAVSAPSARYVEFLQDAASKRVGPLVRQHAWSWGRLGELHCQLHAENEPDEQIVTIIGRRNRPELVAIRAEDVGGVQFHVSESSLSGSIPSARVSQLETLVPTLFGPPPYPPQALRAFFDYIRMPDALELETGTSALDDWAENVVCRVVDEMQQPNVNPAELEPEELDALRSALMQRKYAGDYFDWPPETLQVWSGFMQAIKQAIQQGAEAAKAEQDQEMQKQMQAQAALERDAQAAQAEKGIRTAYGRARAEALKELARPRPVPQPGSNENEEEPNVETA